MGWIITFPRPIIQTSDSIYITIYRYDPNYQDNLGPAVLMLYQGYPGYITYRDLTDPLFNNVAWMAFPAHLQAVSGNDLWVALTGANGQLEWYTQAHLMQLINATIADAQAGGQPTGQYSG